VGRRTNIALEVLLVVALVTGVAGFLSGSSGSKWLLVVHGSTGIAILLLAPWKLVVVRRGLRRARADSPVSIALAVVVGLCILTGLVHSTGLWVGRGAGSPIGVHVLAASASVPLLVWHVIRRPQAIRRGDLSRRTVLRAGALGGASLAIRTVSRADLRFTGSSEVSSFDPAGMPAIQWFDDTKPDLPSAQWRLRVGEEELTYSDIDAYDDELVATLDCTGGWYSTQRWRGVRLDRLLGARPDGRSLVVTSATGYSRRFPLDDRHHLLLATHVGGEPLRSKHGAPARLVAPGRRGFWWVKWVTSIDTSDRPWWLQSPIPLS
jgi:hypothetical protein